MDENYINESADIQEVADPEDEALESEEMQDVADPDYSEDSDEGTDDGRTAQDAAFAEMRRTNQALERANRQMREALSRYFEGETDEELSINALAYAEQRDPDEYREEYERYEVKLHGLECIQCGCCTYVCPAKRPLMQMFKQTKADILARKRAEGGDRK